MFQLQFIIHLLADILEEVNFLSLKFQEDNVDITTMGRDIYTLISLLRERYGDERRFGLDSELLNCWLKGIQNGIIVKRRATLSCSSVYISPWKWPAWGECQWYYILAQSICWEAHSKFGIEILSHFLCLMLPNFFHQKIIAEMKTFTPTSQSFLGQILWQIWTGISANDWSKARWVGIIQICFKFIWILSLYWTYRKMETMWGGNRLTTNVSSIIQIMANTTS